MAPTQMTTLYVATAYLAIVDQREFTIGAQDVPRVRVRIEAAVNQHLHGDVPHSCCCCFMCDKGTSCPCDGRELVRLRPAAGAAYH